MKFLDENKGQYNFEDKLQETIKAYCGDDFRAKLFLKRLSILRQITDSTELKWLHEKQRPRKVLHLMNVLDDKGFFKNEVLVEWSTYVDAYNDLHPKDKTTLRAAIPFSDTDLIAKINHGRLYYPQKNSVPWRILDEILKSWADSNVLVSPAGVFARLGLKPGDYYMISVRSKMVKEYVKLKYPKENGKKQKLIQRYSKNQKSLIDDLVKDKQTLFDDLKSIKIIVPDATKIKRIDDYLTSRPKFLKRKPNSHVYNILTEIKRIDDYLASLPKLLKRKPESHPDNARDQQRPRGK